MHGRKHFRLLEQTKVLARNSLDMYLERIEVSSEITRSGMDITVYEYEIFLIAVWQQDGYAFVLTVHGNCDIDLLIRLIESVLPQ